MKKKRILMVCEAFGGGVFTYVSQLCNDMVDEFDVYLALWRTTKRFRAGITRISRIMLSSRCRGP